METNFREIETNRTALWKLPWLFPYFSIEAERTLVRVGRDVNTGILSLVLPATGLYIALYALTKNKMKLFEILTLLASVGFIWSSLIVVLECSLMRSVQLFVGEKTFAFSVHPISLIRRILSLILFFC